MQRRQCLEAALTAVGFPLSTVEASGDADAAFDNVSDFDTGAARASVQSHDPVWGQITMAEFDDDGSEIRVNGYHNDDKPQVECKIHINHATANVTFPPERARELAAELALAAEFAEQGEEVATEVDDG